MEDFVTRKSDFPNRRRLEIISQTPNEIVADIYRDEGNVDVAGTPITAKILNDMKDEFANKGTTIKINEQSQTSLTFTSDPQTQIDDIQSNVSINTNNILNLQTNKADVDASNLTEDNIQSWQNQLNDLWNIANVGDTSVYISGQATVKEVYLSSDKSIWYRKWSDGWKECGGTYDAGQRTGDTTFEITFPNLEFSNNNYILLLMSYNTSGATASRATTINAYYKSTTQFKAGWWYSNNADNSSQYCDWYACGY